MTLGTGEAITDGLQRDTSKPKCGAVRAGKTGCQAIGLLASIRNTPRSSRDKALERVPIGIGRV